MDSVEVCYPLSSLYSHSAVDRSWDLFQNCDLLRDIFCKNHTGHDSDGHHFFLFFVKSDGNDPKQQEIPKKIDQNA